MKNKQKFIFLKKTFLNIQKQLSQLKSNNLLNFVGSKVKIRKNYVDWILENGETCGIPYQEIDFIKKRPTGKIESVRFDPDGFTFHVSFDNYKEILLFGIEDLDLLD